MISDFQGKTAVLTGAGSGFGLECARIGAKLGMNLVLVDVRPDALDKARAARTRIDAYQQASGRCIRLEIDGGVNTANIADIARAGVDAFVAGSAVYGAGKDSDPHRYDSIISALRAELAGV